VVEGLAETEEVLRAVFEPRGMQVSRVRAHEPLTDHSAAPSLIVLHEDSPPAVPQGQALRDVPRVIIGSASVPTSAAPRHTEQYLQKPFHYGELIAAIESLLDRPDASR
jgi:DNA-binding response OmpR family regulator